MTEIPQHQPMMPNPFVGVPKSDFARDGAAAFLLIIALFYPWNGTQKGGALWYLDLVTLLALAALVVTYLARAKLLGSAWKPRLTPLVRLAAVAPYALVFAVTALIDIFDDPTVTYPLGGLDGGVGIGTVIGMFAIVLVAQPRAHESTSTALTIEDRVWFWLTFGFFALAVVLNLGSTIVALIHFDAAGFGLLLTLFATIAYLLALATPAAGMLLRKQAWVNAGAGFGVLLVVVAVLSFNKPTSVFIWLIGMEPVETIHLYGFGPAFITLACAAALSPGVRRVVADKASVPEPISTAGAALLLVAALTGLQALSVLVLLLNAPGTGFQLGLLFIVLLSLASAAAAGVAGFLLLASPAKARVIAFAAAVAIAGIGLISAIVIIVNDFLRATIGNWITPLLIAATVASLLLIPARSRSYFAANRRARVKPQAPESQPAEPQTGSPWTAPTGNPAWGAPAEPVSPQTPPQPALDVKPEPIRNADALLLDAPDTAPTELARIAEHSPELRPRIALHPNAYDGLLTWLGALRDPDVDAALAHRTNNNN